MKKGNEYYSVEADKEKNRINFSLIGKIPNVGAIPNFKSDWESTVREVKKGFTILADLSKSESLEPDVEQLNTEVQGWLMGQGLRKVAQLIGDLSVMSQVNEFAETSGMRDVLRAFNFEKSALIWLNMEK